MLQLVVIAALPEMKNAWGAVGSSALRHALLTL